MRGKIVQLSAHLLQEIYSKNTIYIANVISYADDIDRNGINVSCGNNIK